MAKRETIEAQLIAVRRNQILDAATQVFAEKGFHRATIKDVARVAEVADGTIYNYFENKTALLLGILDRLNETSEREAHFMEASAVGIKDWVQSYIKQRYETFSPEAFNVFQVILSEILVNPEIRDLYMQQVVQPTYEVAERFFRQWVDEGSVKPVDPALALRVVSGMFLGVLMLRLMGDPPLQTRWNELPDVMTQIILNGLVRGENDE